MNDANEYNGEELIKQASSRSSDNTRNITTYTWFNHNAISQTAGSGTETLRYYADKPRQNGDYLDFFQLIAGYDFLRTENLLKTFGNSTLTYDFGIDGNIAALTISWAGGTPSTVNYQYECNWDWKIGYTFLKRYSATENKLKRVSSFLSFAIEMSTFN